MKIGSYFFYVFLNFILKGGIMDRTFKLKFNIDEDCLLIGTMIHVKNILSIS